MLPSPAPDVCWLILLRHGATLHNLSQPPRLQGRAVDLPLSDEGIVQAKCAALLLADVKLSAIYSSAMQRARQTAQIVAEPHGLEIITRPQLGEVNVGRWENHSWAEISETEPEAYRLFQEDAGTHGYAGGENLSQVLARVRPEFDEIVASNIGRCIAVVGHNVVNRAYLAGVLGMSLANARRMMQDNCGVNILCYKAGETFLSTLNATSHLWH